MYEHLHWLTQSGYAGLFLLLAAGIVGLPVPVETLLTVAGYQIYRGRLDMPTVMLVGFLGSAAGITASYWIGRSLGFFLVRKYGRLMHITTDDLARTERWFERSGKWALLAGYFVPVVRHLTGLAAGTVKMPVGEFVVFAYTGALLWSTAFVLLGFIPGKQWAQTLAFLRSNWPMGALLVAGLLLACYAGNRRRRARSQSSRK